MTSTRTILTRLFALVALAGLGVGCGDDGGGSDAGFRFDRSAPADASTTGWTFVDVTDTDNDGLRLKMTIDDADTLHLAWYENESAASGDDCTVSGATGGDEMAQRSLWDVRYATVRGSTVSAIETVAQVFFEDGPPGLDIELDGTTPVVAGVGGEQSAYFCRSSDLEVYRRGGGGTWTGTVAAESGDQASVGHPSSDFGDVVGSWAGLAIDRGTVAVAYQDLHLGGIQSEDEVKSDLELAIGSGGGFSQTAIMPTVGAGIFTTAAFDSERRLIVAYVNPIRDQTDFNRQGLWVSRSDDMGATWEHVLIYQGPMVTPPSLHVDGTTIRVAFYNATLRQPALATLTNADEGFAAITTVSASPDADPTLTMEDRMALSEASAAWGDPVLIGDSRFEEGRHPSVAVGPFGYIAVAYFRCGTTGASACDGNAGVVVSYADGSSGNPVWTQEEVATGNDRCGTNPSVAIDSAGDVHVAYQCVEGGDANVIVASRPAF